MEAAVIVTDDVYAFYKSSFCLRRHLLKGFQGFLHARACKEDRSFTIFYPEQLTRVVLSPATLKLFSLLKQNEMYVRQK